MRPNIIYEDNHLLVIEKPVNMPVQEDKSRDLDVLTMLKKDLKERYQKPGNVYLGLIHRLDRPVGGAMVFAKTSKAAARLSDVLRRRDMQRQYWAVVRGIPRIKEGRLTHYLWKDVKRNVVHTVQPSHPHAKKALLDYEVIASKDGLSLLSVQLITGRSHQIRVQLAASGTPLYGDQKYGKQVNQSGQQLALWSYCITFPHPTKQQRYTFCAAPPNSYPWNLWIDQVKAIHQNVVCS